MIEALSAVIAMLPPDLSDMKRVVSVFVSVMFFVKQGDRARRAQFSSILDLVVRNQGWTLAYRPLETGTVLSMQNTPDPRVYTVLVAVPVSLAPSCTTGLWDSGAVTRHVMPYREAQKSITIRGERIDPVKKFGTYVRIRHPARHSRRPGSVSEYFSSTNDRCVKRVCAHSCRRGIGNMVVAWE